MIGNALDDETQISFWVEAVKLGRTDQAIDRGGAFAAGIGTGEQIVSSVQRRRRAGNARPHCYRSRFGHRPCSARVLPKASKHSEWPQPRPISVTDCGAFPAASRAG